MSRLFSVFILSSLMLGISANADPVEATFVGVNGTADWGYYIGPYTGTLDGNLVTLYCVDFANEVTFGEQWEANLTLLSSGDLSNTRYGGAVDVPNALQLYLEAAWLTTQYAIHPGS